MKFGRLILLHVLRLRNPNAKDMPLDLSKLKMVKTRPGKTIAQCPACAETGADKKGEHLAIFPGPGDPFDCIAFQGEDAQAREHRRRIHELAGLPTQDAPPDAPRTPLRAKPAPVDWQACCKRLLSDASALERLAEWRGWTQEFCHALASAGVPGLHEGRIAFPVRELDGTVTGLHVFAWPESTGAKAWYVNGNNKPLLIGAQSLDGVREVNVCESQWDALSLLHARGWKGEPLEKPFVVTRGTSVNPSLAEALSGVGSVILWPQNDAPKNNGARPSEDWIARVCALLPASVVSASRADTPDGAKDWNDVLREHGQAETLRLATAARTTAREVHREPGAKVAVIHEPAPVQVLPTPEPLPSALSPVASFNDAWLPESLRGWIADIAERMQCPPDFVAVAAMVSLSAVAGRRFAIQPKEHDTSWFEHPHVWGMNVGRPSLMKSPAMQTALRPLRLMESEAFRTHSENEKARKTAALKAKLQRDALASKAKKAFSKDKGDEFDVSSLLDGDECEADPLRRFIVNDASMEALGEVLRDNPNGTMLYQDELSGLLAMMEKEGNLPLRAFLLSAWAGKEGFTFDRIIRGMRRVEHCAVSVLGGIQPGVVASRFRDAQSGGSGDDGFMQRFSLLVWPDVSGDWENIDRAPDSQREAEALAVFQTMEAFSAADLQRHAPLNRDGIPVFHFAPDAQERFTEWRTTLEHRLRSDELPPAMEAHLGKYRKLVPALAVLTHVAEWQGGGVSLAALEKALSWVAYLETHAARAYGSRAVASAESARRLLKKLQDGSARLTPDFTARDVKRKGWSGMATTEEAKAACEMLSEYAWLLTRAAGTTDEGGRPTVLYRLNPRAGNGDVPA